MNTVGIIGYGRFGKVLATILQKGFSINIYDVKPSNSLDNISFVTLDEVLNERVIFIAVPIHNFENLLKKISKAIKINRTIRLICKAILYNSLYIFNLLN